MSDTKFFAYENESIDNCDFEVNIDHELIAIVKINRFLYDKTEKLYANGNVKTKAQIDASLAYPLEGKFILIIEMMIRFCTCRYNMNDKCVT